MLFGTKRFPILCKINVDDIVRALLSVRFPILPRRIRKCKTATRNVKKTKTTKDPDIGF